MLSKKVHRKWSDGSKYMSHLRALTAPRSLAAVPAQVDTLPTYHRTWETGVGYDHEGHRIQPFIIFQHLSPKLLPCIYNRHEEPP